MKHLRFLLLSLMTALFASNAMAEKTGKILWDKSKSTIVFVYDEMNYEKDGTFITHDTEYTITSIFSLSLSNDNSTESSGPLSDFSDKTSVTTAVFDKSFADARPYCTNYWFSGLQNLTEIVDIKYLNTSETCEMLGMFEGCSSLESIDLSNFNTAKVTTMEKMFYQCSSLKMIDVSSFVTTVLANTIQMFASCSALEIIYCGEANTNWFYNSKLKYENSLNMFSECTNLKGVEGNRTYKWSSENTYGGWAAALYGNQVGYFSYATAKVLLTNDSNRNRAFIFVYDAKKYETGSTQYTFNGTKYTLSGVYTLDITKSYNSEDLPWQGQGIPSTLRDEVKSVIIDQSFANARPTSTQYWFSSLWSLTNIVGIENLNTSHVTSMQGMFAGCRYYLENLDLSSFNTENVTDMSSMFYYCKNLKTLNLTGFNTSNVTTMASMFRDCQALPTVDLTGFNTEKLTTMESMFSSCYALPTIDLNNFNTAEVTTMADMFSGCTGLVSFDLSKFDITKLTNTSSMFSGCSALETILCGKDTDWSRITSADNMFKGCSKLVGSNGTTSLACDGEKNVGATYAKVCTDGDGYFTFGSPKVLWDAKNKTLIFAFGGKNYTEYKAGETTYTITETYPLDITTSYETTPWSKIARDVQKVIFDDTFAAARPVSTARWFKEMRTLTSIEGIQNLNTSEVIDMAEMFYNCQKLSSLTFGSDFNTAKVTTMYRMFYSCSALSTLDLSNFNTAKVTTMEDMFSFCEALSSLNVSSFNTANVTTMKSMFFYCKTLTSLNLTSFNTANVTTMESMFQNCLILGTLDLSSFNTANVATMKSMFSNCEALTSLTFGSNFNTANVTTMESMFDNCKALTSLDLSKFNTAKVTAMLCMFRNCSSLGTLDVSGFNTTNVTDMSHMFNGCKALTSLVLSNFDTAKVTSMSYMFNACEALTSLDLSKFNTAKVTTMLCMFEGCSKLAEINMSNFDTSEVTDMMSMFSKCGKLEELDLTSFTGEKLTNISNMFQECTSLKTIYCSAGTDWSEKKADYTFSGCSTKLTGKYNGKEFAWSENNAINGTYAKVCTTGEDGYFTNPNPNYTQKVTDARMATLYLDYPAKIPDGVLVYYCTGLNEEEAVPTLTTTAKQIKDVIPAKTGVFVMALAGDYTYAYSTETPATVTDNILTGSVAETTPEANSVLTLGRKENDNTLGFWYFTGEKIPANSAWIPASVYESGLEIGVKIVFPDDTDGIQEKEIEMADGQQVIFDLQGRKMASNGNLPRGIYVVNGRKMVIK